MEIAAGAAALTAFADGGSSRTPVLRCAILAAAFQNDKWQLTMPDIN
jgi:hypothetical protein